MRGLGDTERALLDAIIASPDDGRSAPRLRADALEHRGDPLGEIGLGDKLRAYSLQEAGQDTVDANLIQLQCRLAGGTARESQVPPRAKPS